MSSGFFMQAGLLATVAVGGAYYLAQNPAIEDTPTPVAAPTVKPTSQPRSASVVSIPRTNGQFYTQSRVNRGSVRFLVDTGASAVALTL
ncbi:MAG: hypothetical protein AAF926_01805, partial [Pseudomonadota bacterium]